MTSVYVWAYSTCICMDATHGTNMYDFKLITLQVRDEFGEDIPVAWVITNMEDATLLVEFNNVYDWCVEVPSLVLQ